MVQNMAVVPWAGPGLSRRRSGSDLDVLYCDGVHHGPVVFAMAVAAGEALGLFKRFKDL